MAILSQKVLGWLVMFTDPETLTPGPAFDAAAAALDDPTNKGLISVIAHDGFPRLSFDELEGLSDVYLAHDFPVVVLTAHRNTRALLTALQWMGGRIRDFPSDKIDEAFDWLEMPAEDREQVVETIAKLRLRVQQGEGRS